MSDEENNEENSKQALREPMDITADQLMMDLCAAIDAQYPDKMLVMLVTDTKDGGWTPKYFMSGVENTDALGLLEVWKHDLLSIIDGGPDDDEDEDDDEDDDDDEDEHFLQSPNI